MPTVPDRRMGPSAVIAAEPRTTTAPVVSVCIANWNCKNLLRDCLQSLLHGPQGVRFEIIVVDNASSDGAAEMTAAEFPQVTLVRNATNRGFSAANNRAAGLARGQYFFFLNNDTVVPEYTLARLVAAARENPHAGMFGPRLIGRDGQPQISYRRTPTLPALCHRISFLRWTGLFRRAYYDYRRADYHADGERTVEALMGAAVFLPRHAFEDGGGWDEGYKFGGEDLDLSARVNATRPVVYCGGIEVVHFGRVASRSNAGYVAGGVAAGYVRFLRRNGASEASIRAYQLAVTADAPIQVLLKTGQAAGRWLRGEREKARKSWASATAAAIFLARELPGFWRA
jgi:N-acetylglucosaminyl-diphospho-decaprenol L-rhamnosyltransferase